MRLFFVSFLLLGSLGLNNCSAPLVKAPSTSARSSRVTHTASGTAVSLVPGPDSDYRSVRPENVRSEDSAYAATLPVLDDPDGTIHIRVAVNPHAHALEKISVLFAPHKPTVTYRQIGQGIGIYDTKTGHYYFNAAYQKVRQLEDGRTDHGNLQEISGWVHPGGPTAAVAHKALPEG